MRFQRLVSGFTGVSVAHDQQESHQASFLSATAYRAQMVVVFHFPESSHPPKNLNASLINNTVHKDFIFSPCPVQSDILWKQIYFATEKFALGGKFGALTFGKLQSSVKQDWYAMANICITCYVAGILRAESMLELYKCIFLVKKKSLEWNFHCHFWWRRA